MTIEHVLHEFSHLPRVTEDTLDIMMNLRKVAFVLHSTPSNWVSIAWPRPV